MTPPRCSHRALALPMMVVLILAFAATAQSQPFAVPAHREDGALVFDGIPRLDPALDARIQRYEHWRAATFLDWTSGGAMLIATRFGRADQVHRVAAPLGMREQLTFGEGAVIGARAQPNGPDFVFTREVDGHPQIYLYSAPDSVRALTHGPYLHGSPVWSRDGKRIAFYGTDRTGFSYDIYVDEVAKGSRPRLLAAGASGLWRPCDWSIDDRELLVLDRVAPQQSVVYAVNVASGALEPLLTQNARITEARFAPNGVGIYLLTDQGSQFERLDYYNPITKTTRQISPDVPWDVEEFAVSADASHVAYVIDDDGSSRMTVVDTLHKLDLTPPGLTDGVISNIRFDRTGRRLGFSFQSARRPEDAYVYDLDEGTVERWTHSEIGPLDAANLAPAHLVHFPTWDRLGFKRRRLSAYVYLPRGTHKCPVLIRLHGGLAAQFRPGWHPFLQFIVNDLGYAVIAPNVRGSAGYGKDFRALDEGRRREYAVRDVGALLVWIGLQPGFDSHRVAVMGHSYGGWLALESLATYDRHLRGAIDMAGITNLVDFVKRSPLAARAERLSMFGDIQDADVRAYLDELSPIDDAAQIQKPVLVVQGLDGPGSRAADSVQLVWRLRSQGDTVWYLSAHNTGDGFSNPLDHQAYLDTAARFLRMLAK